MCTEQRGMNNKRTFDEQGESAFFDGLASGLGKRPKNEHRSRVSIEDVSRVSVELLDTELWRAFDQHRTEMILTSSGRCVFPNLKIRVSGLEPFSVYSIAVDFPAVSNIRWKYNSEREKWSENGIINGSDFGNENGNIFFNSEGMKTGSYWCNCDSISFADVKLSNKPHSEQSNGHSPIIFLKSFQLYQARFHIFKVDQNSHSQNLIKKVIFPETKFIAVTTYQNRKIKDLKKASNPFARAFKVEQSNIEKEIDQGTIGQLSVSSAIGVKEPENFDFLKSADEESAKQLLECMTRRTSAPANDGVVMLPSLRFGDDRDGANYFLGACRRQTEVTPENAEINIELLDVDLWTHFKNHTTEMIITNKGRCVFPFFRVRVTGLDPTQVYAIAVEFVPEGNTRWKFDSEAKKWLSSGDICKPCISNIYYHPSGAETGAAWEKGEVSFSKMKLTNKSSNKDGSIALNSFQKYYLMCHVLSITSNSERPKIIKSVGFKETEFIAVTCYQNMEMKRLKKSLNPFAKVGMGESVEGSEKIPKLVKTKAKDMGFDRSKKKLDKSDPFNFLLQTGAAPKPAAKAQPLHTLLSSIEGLDLLTSYDPGMDSSLGNLTVPQGHAPVQAFGGLDVTSDPAKKHFEFDTSLLPGPESSAYTSAMNYNFLDVQHTPEPNNVLMNNSLADTNPIVNGVVDDSAIMSLFGL
eukprot:Nk52_evm15s1360 gene=Nk52_evmTU15s1360